MTNEQGSGNSTVGIIAIVAVLAILAFAAWMFMGRGGADMTTAPGSAPQQQSAPAPADNNDINVKVDLPDSVTIKP